MSYKKNESLLVYIDLGYIVKDSKNNSFELVIGNSIYNSLELSELELILYKFYLSELNQKSEISRTEIEKNKTESDVTEMFHELARDYMTRVSALYGFLDDTDLDNFLYTYSSLMSKELSVQGFAISKLFEL